MCCDGKYQCSWLEGHTWRIAELDNWEDRSGFFLWISLSWRKWFVFSESPNESLVEQLRLRTGSETAPEIDPSLGCRG